jgi:putative transposase
MPLQFGHGQLGLYELRAWVLMINHVHILIYPQTSLPRITKAVKNFSARKANILLGRTGQPFWQDEFYDHWMRNPKDRQVYRRKPNSGRISRASRRLDVV